VSQASPGKSIMEKKANGSTGKVTAEAMQSSLREAEEAFAAALAHVRACAARAKSTSVNKVEDASSMENTATTLPDSNSAQAELLAAQEAFAAARASVREWKLRGSSAAVRSDGNTSGGETIAPLPPNPAWAYYPAPVAEVPREANDSRFTHSFDLTHNTSRTAADIEAEAKAAQVFFGEWGFVVIANVLSPPECSDTLSEIWATLEERTPGLNRNDAGTYALLSPQR